MRLGFYCVFLGASLGCSVEVEPEAAVSREAARLHEFDVDFQNCTEFAGIGSVPKANAAPFVPAHYTLAGDANNAVVVVRVARCTRATVDGKETKETSVAQVGVSLVGPDTSADINNYTVYLATDDEKLANRLKRVGVDNEKLKEIGFKFNANGALKIDVEPKHDPAYKVIGTAVAPTAAPTVFTASWWFDGDHGPVRMRTVFPAIRFGSSSMTLTTAPGCGLASLIGGTSLTFPFLDSYNAFPFAHMEVDTM